MECPSCHCLNPDDALACVSCGMPLIRRHDPGHRSKNPLMDSVAEVPIEGLGFALSGERKARRFLAVAVTLAAMLAAAILFRRPLMAMGARLAGGQSWGENVALGVIAAYGWLVLAHAVGKTGEATGAGFGACFRLAVVPPLLPAALARAGARSPLVPYAYLTLDVVVFGVAWRLLGVLPILMTVAMTIVIVLAAYHLTGCAIGALADALGLTPRLSTLWACGAPLAGVGWLAYKAGVAMPILKALIYPPRGLNPDDVRILFDPAALAGQGVLWAGVCVWLALGWVFWARAIFVAIRDKAW